MFKVLELDVFLDINFFVCKESDFFSFLGLKLRLLRGEVR